jgi:hypothetical protein
MLHCHFIKSLHWESWAADMVNVGFDMSLQDNIASCILLVELDLVVHILYGGLSSSSWEM